MNYQNIILNFLTSSLVVATLTHFLTKHIDKRFNKIEEFQRTLITIRKEQYDTFLKALQEIWEKIIDTERYLRHDLHPQLEKALKNNNNEFALNHTPVLDTFFLIEKRSIFLPAYLRELTMDFYKNHLENTVNAYYEVVRNSKDKIIIFEDFYSKTLGEAYEKEKANLKAKFAEEAKKIINYNNINKI